MPDHGICATIFIDFSRCCLFFLCAKFELLIQFVASVVLLGLGYLCARNIILTKMCIAQTASFYCLYFIGHILGLYKEKYANWSWNMFLCCFVVSFGGLLFLNNVGLISLSTNRYENPVFLLATSMLGWLFLYSLSYFIKYVPELKKTMIVIGKNTLSIVILHFLCMKIVAVFVVLYYKVPWFCIAAFPNLYGEKGCWWVAYTVVGVAVPVGLNLLFCRVQGLFAFNINNKNVKRKSY